MNAVDSAAAVLGPLARRDVPLGPMTTYRVGGPAALFCSVGDEPTLSRVVEAVGVSGVPTLVVGNGSNLLVADAGFAGLAISLGEAFAAVEPLVSVEAGGAVVRAGGAALLPVVARRTAALGLGGFEWAVGVPGSIGGAVRMNAGGHGSDMAAVCSRVRRVDLGTGEDVEVSASQLHLRFRGSDVTRRQVILRADLQLVPRDRGEAEAAIAEVVRWRREHQPGGANAGSVFVNPEGDSAGRLVDLAGCRGSRHRSASVSAKHANFIQADEGGSADDIYALMASVRDRVEEVTGVRLRAETRLVGFEEEQP